MEEQGGNLCLVLYAFGVRVCVCASGEPLVQLLLFKAAAVGETQERCYLSTPPPSRPSEHIVCGGRWLSDEACSFVPPTLLVHVGSHGSSQTPTLVVM